MQGSAQKNDSSNAFVILIGIWNPFDRIGTECFGFMISRDGYPFFLDDQISDDHCFNAYNGIRCGFRRTVQMRRGHGSFEVLVTQLFLLNRYIRLIVEETHNTLRARVFRGGRITLSNAIVCGPLLMRSLSRSEKIHNALLCRGSTVLFGAVNVV